MARLKDFDEDRAIDAAVDCFWAHGYEATSVRDLAEAMGRPRSTISISTR